MAVTAAAVAILMGAGGTAWAFYSWADHSPVKVTTANAIEPGVTILDEVTGLLPGQAKPVRIEITNRNDFPVRITKIAGGNIATGDCPAWAVRVTPTTETAYAVTLARRSTTTLKVRIGMEKWADQKCAGKQFDVDLVTTMGPAY
jgi:hypothetical protein